MKNKVIIKALFSTIVVLTVIAVFICGVYLFCIYVPGWLQLLMISVAVGWDVVCIFGFLYKHYKDLPMPSQHPQDQKNVENKNCSKKEEKNMTIIEFLETKWHVGMRVEILSGLHKGNVFDVICPDFDQALIGCYALSDDDETLVWFRCENCKIV